METTLNNKQCPFLFNTINGHIPSSLLNRPSNGILAQQNGFIKLISTKTNVISSRINEIKQSALILYGDKDYVIPHSSSQYLAQKLVDVQSKQINALENAGHLWWLSHCKQSTEIIDQFLFKIERNLLTRYDVIIQNILKNQEGASQTNNDQYTMIVTSKSFIADENDQYQQQYQVSSNDIKMQYPLTCKFLCIMTDLARKPLEIQIKSKDKKLIGIGQCMLTEATNAELLVDILSIDNNDVLMKFNIKHGWNKNEFQQRLNDEDYDNAPDITPNGFDNNNGNDRARLDSADLDGLDL